MVCFGKTLISGGIMGHPLFCLLDIILASVIDDNALESELAARYLPGMDNTRQRWNQAQMEREST